MSKSTLLTQSQVQALLTTKVQVFKDLPKNHDRNTAYGVFMNLEKDSTPLQDTYDFWEECVGTALDLAYGPRIDLEDGF